MKKTQDYVITWKGFGSSRSGKWYSKCRLRIYQGTDKTVVVFSDLDDEDTGTSITNSSENVATLVKEKFNLNDEITWIEHYPRHKQKYEPPFDQEDFSVVKYESVGERLKSPKWQYISKSELETMVGADFGMDNTEALPSLYLGK